MRLILWLLSALSSALYVQGNALPWHCVSVHPVNRLRDAAIAKSAANWAAHRDGPCAAAFRLEMLRFDLKTYGVATAIRNGVL